MPLATVYGTNWVAQTFRPQENFIISNIRIYGQKYDSDTIVGNVTVSIKNIGNDELPTGNDLISSVLANAGISTTLGWIDFRLPNSLVLSVNNPYVLILRAINTDVNNPFIYTYENTGGYLFGSNYTRGYFMSSINSGTDWTIDTTVDMYFETYGYGELVLSAVRTYKEANLTRSDKDINLSRSYKELSINSVGVI